jgi:smad nuclear-interacting protein 1
MKRKRERGAGEPEGEEERPSGVLGEMGTPPRKFDEPPDACAPPPASAWALLVFKDGERVGRVELRRASLLLGRDRRVADMPTDHASCSGQHAAVVFRARRHGNDPDDGEDDDAKPPRAVPYVMDLNSTHGTFLNHKRLPAARWVELRAGDVLQLAASARKYVLVG